MRKILEFPENRQVYNYDCGANSVLSVLQYYGYMGREDKLMELGDTDSDGTSIEGIENILKHFKVGYETKQKMTIDEIRKHIDGGFPTIISIQAYPDDNNKDLENDIDDGHYVVAIGYDDNGIIMEDPSCCYRTYLTDDELIERWHDEDEIRLGTVIYGEPKFKKDGIVPLKEYEIKVSRELVKMAKELMADDDKSRINDVYSDIYMILNRLPTSIPINHEMNLILRECLSKLTELSKSVKTVEPVIFNSVDDILKALKSFGADEYELDSSRYDQKGWMVKREEKGWLIWLRLGLGGPDKWVSKMYHVPANLTMNQLKKIYTDIERAAIPARKQFSDYARGYSEYLDKKYPRGIPSYPTIMD